MTRLGLVGALLLIMVSSLSAQEKLVDHYAVSLGLMPWENIFTEYPGDDFSFSAYQYRMAQKMAAMHGGGKKGDYHVLVVIEDRDSGQHVKDANVTVVVYSKGTQIESATLEHMEMDGFAGYGGYMRFKFEKPYTLRVSFKRPPDDKVRKVEFSHQP